MYSTEDLQNAVYFWQEADKEFGVFSQWYYCPFKDDGDETIIYKTAEHYMMYHKALLFNDPETASQILQAGHPQQVKELGRRVRNFEEEKWTAQREVIVRNGTILKFTNAVTEEATRAKNDAPFDAPFIEDSLKEMLLVTGDRLIVEASPYDRIWGVGFGPENAKENYRQWGMNLLGKALMGVKECFEKMRRTENTPEE